MRRSGYSSFSNSKEGEASDELDGEQEDIEDAKSFTELRFAEEKSHRKTLCLVFTLFFGGFLTLTTSSLILIGHLDNKLYADRLVPLIILGCLMFVPGAYFMRIAYYTFRGRAGFSYEQIPSCY